MAHFLSEVTRAVLAASWTKLGSNDKYNHAFNQYTGYALAGSASPLNDVTVTLRKATSSGGANATTIKAATDKNGSAQASVNANDLGEFSPGVPFTHVQAVLTDQASPNTVTGFAVLSHPKFTTPA